MKCLSVRVIAPSLLIIGTVLSPVLAWSMDEMTDSQLSTATGQDGITVLIAPPTLTATQQSTLGVTRTNGLIVGAAVLHDKDGLGAVSTYNKGGALIFGDASQANVLNAQGVQMGFYASAPIVVTIDASNGKMLTGLGGASPVLNVNVALPADLMIRTGDVSLGASNRSEIAYVVGGSTIAVGSSGAIVANASVGGTRGSAYKIMNSMDISFGGQALSFNVQLGNTPQGGMISFGNLKISTINFSSLSLASPNGGAFLASQLTMTPKITDLDLTGMSIGAVNDIVGAMTNIPAATPVGGLLLTDNSFTVGSVQFDNVTAGNLGAVDANFAGGMPNASMGSFGVTGMSVTNLKIGVSGM